MSADAFSLQRERLITALRLHGIEDPRVLTALARVPRERFVSPETRHLAYVNAALPLRFGQTISQPFVVALMTQVLHLDGHERVLEVGTGSGYQTAILACLAAHVYSVERHFALAQLATQTLASLQFDNLSFLVGDGSRGWPAEAPYDAILVTAAAPHIPAALVSQLRMGARLVLPIGAYHQQELLVVQRLSAHDTSVTSLGPCVFVPLIGDDGWGERH